MKRHWTHEQKASKRAIRYVNPPQQNHILISLHLSCVSYYIVSLCLTPPTLTFLHLPPSSSFTVPNHKTMNLFVLLSYFQLVSSGARFLRCLNKRRQTKYGILKLCSEYLIARAWLLRCAVQETKQKKMWEVAGGIQNVQSFAQRIVINWILSTLFRVIFISIGWGKLFSMGMDVCRGSPSPFLFRENLQFGAYFLSFVWVWKSRFEYIKEGCGVGLEGIIIIIVPRSWRFSFDKN